MISSLIDFTLRLKKFDTANAVKIKDKKLEKIRNNEKTEVLNCIIDILLESDKGTDGHMFKYADQLDLLKAQHAMIHLALHCLIFAENASYLHKKDYYEIIT